jgi:hypothetical protein
MKQLPIVRILAVGAIFIILAISALSGGWYRYGWNSRRAITINNLNGDDVLINFQVGIQVPCYPFMQDDFDDIRFTTADGCTEIPYWIEEYTTGQEAMVWIRVPHIPAHGTTRIYLYYNNLNAVGASNGVAVFEYFDDFNDQDISDWTVICGSWTAENKYLEQMLTANHRMILSPYAFDGPPTGMVVEAKMNYMSSYPYSGNCIYFSDTWAGGTGYRFGFHGLNGNGTAIDKIYQWLDSNPTIYTGNYGYTWLKGKVTYDGDGNYTFLLKAPDGVFVLLGAFDETYSAPFVLGNYCGSHTGLDDIRVRKNAGVEPGYDIGVEEKVKKKKDTDSEIHLLLLGPVFSRQKRVQLMLPVNAIVSGDLYDCSGRKVSSIFSEKRFTKGQHVISLDDHLVGRPSGSYFVWFVAEQEDGKRKVLGKKLHYLR